MTALIVYATRYGSTREVAEAVAGALRDSGLDVDVMPARRARRLDRYCLIVLGAPLFMFRWHRDARAFLTRNREAVGKLPTAVFALGPFYKNDEEERREARAQLDKELAQFPRFVPCAREVFGGKLDLARIGFPLNMFLRSLPQTDFRNWDEIRQWGGKLAAVIQPSRPGMEGK